MYLARERVKGRLNYFLRQSVKDKRSARYRSVTLFDLGPEPAEYIIYPGGNAFYVDPVITESIEDQGIAITQERLEEILWPFIDPLVRYSLEPFVERCRREARLRRGDKTKVAPNPLHELDKRRFYYIRYGVRNQRRINTVPARFFGQLFGKSRDELEQYFMELEAILNPGEYKEYVFTIFDLQQHFVEHTAREHPYLLRQEQLDKVFLERICTLQADQAFWYGMRERIWLHPYLRRYLIMFFDYDFMPERMFNEYWTNFINSKRFYNPPRKKADISPDDAARVFGVEKEELAKMSHRSLTRLYRKLSKKLHPDVGGEHETFLTLTETYQELLLQKKSGK